MRCYHHFSWQCVCVCSVCEGGEGKTEERCAYYFTSSAWTLSFSEAMHCLYCRPHLPTLARTRNMGALELGSSSLSQL